ncbi:hypothetical protein QO002_005296 [Pararhizobium capsulatum DSM 1112]|uniref:Uncharacterized protein n=1 Tax=Pararhizobium capsulatum DSM 1112 TaxID=1121113 RepID=A0ABU0C085_9HYPH|nr:hypothetical protein [Pararhizobium capsulatum]MDQ0323090.1 hypothetical protein [Pararhizobium capsulatum DSM 1112]
MDTSPPAPQSHRTDVTVASLKKTLSHLFPQVDQHWAKPLDAYASAVYRLGGHRTGCSARDEAMVFLQNCIERAALRTGATSREAKQCSQQLVAAPVIQTGPHCHLLVEPDAFYTHLFSLLGLTANHLPWHIWYSASTVKFIEKPKKGPGWLLLEGEPVNVFGLPRRLMDSYSICGLNAHYSFKLTGNTKGTPANPSAVRLKALLPQGEFASAADAIKAGNQAFWNWAFPAQPRLLQLDDTDMADLVADHLENPGSWLSRQLFGNGMLAGAIIEAIDQLNAGPWAGWMRSTTDFFWGLANGKLFPLRLGNRMLTAGPGKEVELRFEPVALAAALRGREIVPNLFITFLVTSILPGIRVLGGCQQTVYYPLMRHVFSSALRQIGPQDLLATINADDCPGVWGHRVLKPGTPSPFRELESSPLPHLLSFYGSQPLEQACGGLKSFVGDPLWETLAQQIADGTVHAGSPEWKFAGTASRIRRS